LMFSGAVTWPGRPVLAKSQPSRGQVTQVTLAG